MVVWEVPITPGLGGSKRLGVENVKEMEALNGGRTLSYQSTRGTRSKALQKGKAPPVQMLSQYLSNRIKARSSRA
jgi:hypothetical protein